MPGAPKHLGATHYELLVRALAMLAELSGTFNDRRRYLLLGAHYATSLYNLNVRSANSVAHKEQKDAARAARWRRAVRARPARSRATDTSTQFSSRGALAVPPTHPTLLAAHKPQRPARATSESRAAVDLGQDALA